MKKNLSLVHWKKLQVLGQKQGAIKLIDLSAEMGLQEEETLSFLKDLFPEGTGIEVYQQDSEMWVNLDSDSIHYMLPLSPTEWLQLDQILANHKSENESHALGSLRRKVSESGPIKVVMQLFNQLEMWDQELNDQEQQLVQELDIAVSEKNMVNLKTREGKSYVVHPCRVLHLEGHLSLIAEDSQDHCLTVIPMSNIAEVQVVPTTKAARVTAFEIEEFIMAIRSMNEKETRLILKIHDPQSTNLFPDHHFLGKPCMVTNPNGDLIWAAYVEPCEALYDWLVTLGNKVEILDPVKFKEEYLTYCEEKLRKIA